MWMILATVACLSYEEGKAEEGELNCRLMEACGTLGTVGFADVEACIEHARAQPYDEDQCRAYDAGAMQECLDGWEAAVESADCDAEVAACSSVCS